jgi:hypothetical protein
MAKNKRITAVFASSAKEKPQSQAEEIAAKLVRTTLYQLKNSI